MSSALVTIRRAANLPAEKWPDERIEAIKKMVAPQARSTHELAAFMGTCHRYNLDPLVGEAWLGQLGGKPTVIVGRDAYIKVASGDPEYRGFDSGVVYEKDHFELVREGENVTVHHRVTGFDRGRIKGAYCVAHHATKRPVSIIRLWDAYSHLHGRGTWKTSGEDMIETRAIVAALRRMYRLAGLHTASDGGEELLDPAAATRSRLDELKGDLDKPEQGSPLVQDTTQIPEAEYVVIEPGELKREVVGNDELELNLGDNSSLSTISLDERDAPLDGQSDDRPFGMFRGMYFATLKELVPDHTRDQRKEWQEFITGKASTTAWDREDFKTAIDALRAHESLEVMGWDGRELPSRE